MSILLAVILNILTVDPGKIGEVNTVKSEAREAFASGNYELALKKYRYLTDSLGVNEDEVSLNMANAFFQLNDSASATSMYQSLTGSPKPVIRSKAQQQLGVLNHRQGKMEAALNNFKQAIKADPNNLDARYNYEMLKKKLDEQKNQQQNDQNRDKQNKDQEQKDKKDQQEKDQQNKEQEQKDKEQQQKEQQEKDQQKKDQEKQDKQDKDQKDQKDQQDQNKQDEQKENESKEEKEKARQLSEKLQQMKISEEKARMILEAMKNQEIQYLQQNTRKATKPRDRSKPDW
jgi:hypothetical protein